MVTLQILGGRKEKIRPGDVLGALTGDEGIARDIAHEALKKLATGKVKGKIVKVRALED